MFSIKMQSWGKCRPKFSFKREEYKIWRRKYCLDDDCVKQSILWEKQPQAWMLDNMLFFSSMEESAEKRSVQHAEKNSEFFPCLSYPLILKYQMPSDKTVSTIVFSRNKKDGLTAELRSKHSNTQMYGISTMKKYISANTQYKTWAWICESLISHWNKVCMRVKWCIIVVLISNTGWP